MMRRARRRRQSKSNEGPRLASRSECGDQMMRSGLREKCGPPFEARSFRRHSPAIDPADSVELTPRGGPVYPLGQTHQRCANAENGRPSMTVRFHRYDLPDGAAFGESVAI